MKREVLSTKKHVLKVISTIVFLAILLVFFIIINQKTLSVKQHKFLQEIPVSIDTVTGEVVNFEGTVFYNANGDFYLLLKNKTINTYILPSEKSSLYRFNKDSWEKVIPSEGGLSNLMGYGFFPGETGRITVPGIGAANLQSGTYKLVFTLCDEKGKSTEFFTEFEIK